MACATPGKVLLYHTVHRRRLARCELESSRERHVPRLVKEAGIISESHVFTGQPAMHSGWIDQRNLTHHLGNEDGAFSRGSRRQEMQILPDGAADGTWYSDEMLEAREAAIYRGGNQVGDHGAGLGRHHSVPTKFDMPGNVANDESSKSAVTNENVRAEPQDEPGNADNPRGRHGSSEGVA